MSVVREWREVAGLVWPAAISSLLFALLEVADAAMLGSVGVQEMAGALLASTIIYLVLVFPLQSLRALTPLAAQRAAAGAPLGGLRPLLLWTSAGLGLGASLVLLLVSAALPLLGYEEGLIPAARTFLIWRAPFIGVELAFFAVWATVEGAAGTRAPLGAGLCAVLVNLLLNVVLIPGWFGLPQLGVVGAAISTNVATFCGLLVLLGRLRRLLGPAATTPLWRLDRLLFGAFARMGWPLGLSGLLESVGWLLMGLLIARAGTMAAALHGILGQLLAIGMAFTQGVVIAGVVMVARATGRGDRSEVHRRTGQILTGQLLLGLGLVLAIGVGGERWAGLFTSEAALRSASAALLPLAAAMLLAEGLAQVLCGVVEGTGRTGVLLRATLLFDVGFVLLAVLRPGASLEMESLYRAWLLKNLFKAAFLVSWIERDRLARQLRRLLEPLRRGFVAGPVQAIQWRPIDVELSQLLSAPWSAAPKPDN